MSGVKQMRITIGCSECRYKRLLTGDESVHNKDYVLDVNDDGVYEFVCEEGHKNKVTIQNWKYEILFDMGIKAFKDGYYREAVTNFAAALERFYEYAIKIFCFSQKIEIDKINLVWKDVNNQSERQLGAYCFLYLVVLKSNPEIIKNKQVEFRNKVVHKGFIPTKEEATLYGEEVFNYIRANLILMQKKLGEHVWEYQREYFGKIRSEDTSGLGMIPSFAEETFGSCLVNRRH